MLAIATDSTASRRVRMGLSGAILSLVVFALGLPGCSGPTCGEGAVDVDGTCRLEASGCGEGTVLADGVCVPTESACGPIADPAAGVGCVTNENACSGSTVFDQATGTCVSDESVVCGEGTALGDDGTCHATEDSCEAPTVLGDDGLCVVSAEACVGDTTLDPNANECVSAGVDCVDGMAWDDAASRCVATDEICRTGTRFDESARLCVPEGCEVGDVVIDSVCLPPDAARLEDVDHEHVEEPFGSFIEANRLALPEPGDDPLVVRGRLVTEDADGDPVRGDVDYDAYAFSGEAFEWVEITLLNFGQHGAYFELLGPTGDGRVWRSPPGGRTAMSRQIVLPASGIYRFGVSYDFGEDAEEDGGYPSWYYGLVIQTRSAPQPQVVDVSNGAFIEGDVQNLRDNLYRFEGLSDFQSLEITSEPGMKPADSYLQFWRASTLVEELEPAYDGVEHGSGEDSAVTMLLDWRTLSAMPSRYALSVEPGQSLVDQSLAAGESIEVPRTLDVFDRLEIEGTGFAGLDVLSVEVFAPSGALVTDTTLDEVSNEDTIAFEAGTYRVRITNKSGAARSVDASIRVVDPQDLGVVEASGRSTRSARTDGETRHFRWVASADGWFEVRLDCRGEDFSMLSRVYRADGTEIGVVDEAMTCDYRDVATGMVHAEAGREYLLELNTPDSVAFGVEVREAQLPSVRASSTNSNALISGQLDCTGNDHAWGEVVVEERGYVDVVDLPTGTLRDIDGGLFDTEANKAGIIDRQDLDSQWLEAEPYVALFECGFSSSAGTFDARVDYYGISPTDLGGVADGLTTQTVSTNIDRALVRLVPPGPSRIAIRHRDATVSSVDIAVYDDALRQVTGPRSVFDADASLTSQLDHLATDGSPLYIEIASRQAATLELEIDVTTLDSLGVFDSSDATFTGSALDSYDSDYVAFTLTEPTLLSGTFATAGLPTFNVSILDADGARVADARSDTGFVFPERGVLPPGDYVLELQATSQLAAPYDIDLSARFAGYRSAPNVYVGLGGAQVQDTLSVSGCGVVADVWVIVETQVFETFAFGDFGSLDLEIEHPSGVTVTLSQSSGTAWDNERQVFGVTRAAVDSLASLEGLSADGTWTLRASDTETDHASDVDAWGVLARCQ